MSRVLILVEGQTERAVIQQVISPFLSPKGIYLRPRVVGKPGHKGGVKRSFDSVLKEILALIKQESHSTVTTFFDFYGLPSDWPGVTNSKGKSSAVIPSIIEPAILEAVTSKLGSSFNPSKFIPYVQVYELEALLFAGPKEMADIFEESSLEDKFESIVKGCGGCENINDNPETAPSKRIEKLFPSYKKGSSVSSHAPLIANQIGIQKIRNACPNFNRWIEKLENLPQN